MRAQLLLFILLLVGTALVSVTSFAQMDPSSALLLNGDSRTQTLDSGVDSGRYKVRTKSDGTTKRDDARVPARKASTDPTANSQTPATSNPAANPPGTAVTPPANPSVLNLDPNAEPPVPVLIQLPVNEAKDEKPAASAPVASSAPANGRVTPSDKKEETDLGRRANLLELSVAPGFAYINSDSSYYFRHYSLSAPVISADAHVWFNPNFGVQVSYIGTLSGEISDSFNGTKNVPVSQEWITAGIRSRKFFGSAANAASLSFGVDYYDSQFNVPGDAATRESLESSGVQLSLEAEVPVNSVRLWTFAVTFTPKLNHQEKSTAINFQSGGSVDANAVGLSIGGRLQFEREDAIFWKISESVEKDLFSGPSSVADPVSGSIDSGVSVTDSVTLIQFGYTWGH
jgi:hypothetical protein